LFWAPTRDANLFENNFDSAVHQRRRAFSFVPLACSETALRHAVGHPFSPANFAVFLCRRSVFCDLQRVCSEADKPFTGLNLN
jgi:hypothetical protein